MRGIISIYRSGKHWLLAGIFDTLGIYPKNYLEEVSKDIIPATAKQTNWYHIDYNNFNFICCHFRMQPFMPTDRYILLDRKDKRKQAESLIRALATKKHAAYSKKGQKTLSQLGKLVKITDKQINSTIDFIEKHKTTVLQSLTDIEYRELWYEDLICNYEYYVKDVINYLFNIKVEEIKYKYTPIKLT